MPFGIFLDMVKEDGRQTHLPLIELSEMSNLEVPVSAFDSL